MKSNYANKVSTFKTITYTLKSNLIDNPIVMFISMTLCLLQGLSYGIIARRMKLFFDAIEVNTGSLSLDKNSKEAFFIMILAFIFGIALNGMNNAFHNLISDRLEETALKNLHKKSSKLTPYQFEDTNMLDSIEKARKGAWASTKLLFISMLIISFYIPSLLYLSIFFYTIHPILSITLPVISVPTVINQILRVRIFTELADETGPKVRELNSLEDMIISKEYFKETRQLGIFKFLYDKYIRCEDEIIKKKWKSEKKIVLRETVLRVISLIAYIFMLILIVKLLVSNEISSGSFAAVLSTLVFMFSTLEELIFYQIKIVSNNIGYAKNYVEYMNMKEIKDNVKENIEEGIELKEVSFSYPNQNEKILKNINLSIKKGDTVAIVGANGAGKSTLSKVIMGMYPPSEGKVKYGREIVDFSSLSDEKKISAVMQNFIKYKFKLKENVALSGMEESDVKQKVLNSLKHANLPLEEFDKGLETMLSTEYSGVDLSGGQWQRVAIARGIFKDSELIVLDEPTSAIDPIMETKIYESLRNTTKKQTSIIVTHRLGMTLEADKVIVLDKGEIVEEGTHKELMKYDSKYKEMYLSQTKWYDFSSY